MRFIKLPVAMVVAFAFGLGLAQAQVPASQPPYNTDIGAVLASAQRTAATYNSASQTNLDKRGVVCTLNTTASSGSPSTTFGIQEFDAAASTWFTVKASTAITQYSTGTLGGPYQVAVMPGIMTSSGPTNSDSASWPLTRVWRVQAIVGSGTGAAGPASTFGVGCNYIR